MIRKLSDGTEHDILPLYSRVRQTQHPNMQGEIIGYEFWKGGILSTLPYVISWDDPHASRTLGILCMFPDPEMIEPIANT